MIVCNCDSLTLTRRLALRQSRPDPRRTAKPAAHSATRSDRSRENRAGRGWSARRSWRQHRLSGASPQSEISPTACRKFLILDCPVSVCGRIRRAVMARYGQRKCLCCHDLSSLNRAVPGASGMARLPLVGAQARRPGGVAGQTREPGLLRRPDERQARAGLACRPSGVMRAAVPVCGARYKIPCRHKHLI